MRLGRVTAGTICVIVLLTVNCVSSSPVSMYVKQEAQADNQNYIHVNFYNDKFQRLHDCMSHTNSQKCSVQAAYERSGKPFPGENYKVVNVRSYGTSQLVQRSFTCLYNQQATGFECTRNTGQCSGNNCTSFRLVNSPICGCVDLIWQYPDEKLVFDSNANIEYCTPDCAETTTVHSTEPSSYPSDTLRPSETSLPSEQSSDDTTSSSNATNIGNFGRDESSSNTVPVIIGVVVGVLFIAVIVIVFGFIYRRQKQTKRQANNNGINSSRANMSYNGSAARGNALNIPDVLRALPSSSHGGETNRESDGYYTIDKDDGLNRYENGLNTISSKASQRPPEGVLSSRSLNKYTNDLRVSPHTSHIYEDDPGNSEVSHALDGDYFTIETKNDDGEKNKAVESVPNSRNLNKCTNELRAPPRTSRTYEGDAGNSKVFQVPEGDYFTIDTENDGENNKPIESVLNSRHLNKYTNERRVSPQNSHAYEDEAVKSEPLHAPEGEYFTLETENDYRENETTVDDEKTIDGEYSLAKDVDIIGEAAVVDVIDVSPPPKNIYSKFRDNNNTDTKNPYDMLLQSHQILSSRKISVD